MRARATPVVTPDAVRSPRASASTRAPCCALRAPTTRKTIARTHQIPATTRAMTAVRLRWPAGPERRLAAAVVSPSGDADPVSDTSPVGHSHRTRAGSTAAPGDGPIVDDRPRPEPETAEVT